MFAWEASLEAVTMRRRFDDDEDEFENDGFTFDDEDEEDDLDEELEEEELDEEFEDIDDLDEDDRPRRGRTDDEEWEEE
jgi:hypothetical protein